MKASTDVSSDSVAAALVRAGELHREGRIGAAERLYRDVLRVEPGKGEALHGLGLVAQQAGDLEGATTLLRSATAAEPEAASFRSNLGNVLQMRGLLEEALIEYAAAARLRPASGAVWSNMGTALLGLGRVEEAVEAQRRAAALAPESAQVADNFGNALQAAGRLEEAVGWHRRSLALEDGAVEARGNLGLALAGLGRWSEALACFDDALLRAPENARIQLARAQLQLLLGDLSQGLANYEWRKRVVGERRRAGLPWRGQPLQPGETLVIDAEQGLGDTLQSLRFLPAVKARIGDGARLVIEVQGGLRRLAQGTGWSVVSMGEEMPEGEWHCAWMSLPLALGVDSIATEDAYLAAPKEASARIGRMATERGVLEADSERLQVGLIWAGNRSHARDRFRSVPFSTLAPLLALEGVTFHSLQLGEAERVGARGLIDWSGAIDDMADTAAIMARLDLVIGVDTAVVHLAGALGKRVWTMLPFWPDWRWGLEREDTVWYRTMRLFRQRSPGDWVGVVERIRAALKEEMSRRSGV
jgi:tetratricopeptide (TPR) repeat protein